MSSAHAYQSYLAIVFSSRPPSLIATGRKNHVEARRIAANHIGNWSVPKISEIHLARDSVKQLATLKSRQYCRFFLVPQVENVPRYQCCSNLIEICWQGWESLIIWSFDEDHEVRRHRLVDICCVYLHEPASYSDLLLEIHPYKGVDKLKIIDTTFERNTWPLLSWKISHFGFWKI